MLYFFANSFLNFQKQHILSSNDSKLFIDSWKTVPFEIILNKSVEFFKSKNKYKSIKFE